MNDVTNLVELMKKKKAEYSSNQKETISPQLGANTYVFLPTWIPGADKMSTPFWRDSGKHWIKDEFKSVKAVCRCLAVDGVDCEICKAVETAIKNNTDAALEDALKQAKKTHRVLFNVIPVSKTGGFDVRNIQVLELPKGTADKLFSVYISLQEQGVTDIFDFNRIHPITVTKSGAGLNTEYMVTPVITPVAFDASQQALIAAGMKDLDDFVSEPESNSANAMKALSSVSGSALSIAAPQQQTMIAAQPTATMVQPTVAMVQPAMAQPIVQDLNTIIDDSIPTFSTTVEPAAAEAIVTVDYDAILNDL